MQIFVKTIDGKRIAIEVYRTERIIDVKKKVEEKINLKPEEQKLIFHGMDLEDNKTVDEYQITDQSVINVINKLRNKIEITIQTLKGLTVSIDVQTTERLIDIKKRTEPKIGMRSEKQKWIFQGVILDNDNKTADQCSFEPGSVIDIVSSDSLKIFVRKFAFEISKTERIIDVKKKIAEKIKIVPDEQILYFQGIKLNNENFVDDYPITDESLIEAHAKLKGGFEIFIKSSDGMTFTCQVVKTYRISDIKDMIRNGLRLEPDEQKLTFKGITLENDKTVGEYQIGENSVIDIDSELGGKIQIFVTTMDGKVFAFEVQKFERIIDLKKKIKEKSGLELDEQKLYYEGLTLENDYNINKYNVKDKSTISVVTQLGGGMKTFYKTINRKSSFCHGISGIKRKK